MSELRKKHQKTYNTRDSLVVTDPTTSLALTGLSMGERTGSRVFQWVWSYVLCMHENCLQVCALGRQQNGVVLVMLSLCVPRNTPFLCKQDLTHPQSRTATSEPQTADLKNTILPIDMKCIPGPVRHQVRKVRRMSKVKKQTTTE